MRIGGIVGCVALLAACHNPGAGLGDASALDRATAPRDWTMLTGFGGQPFWLASTDFAYLDSQSIRTAHMLVIRLPEEDGAGPSGWIAIQYQVDCDLAESRILAAKSSTVDGDALALPTWFQPAQEYSPVMPHTVHAMAMTHMCNGQPPSSAPRVYGSPADIHDHQARLRIEQLGY